MSSASPLVRPERSAHAAIRGYLYQTCLGIVRWLDLDDDEVLVVEGDEDLDRLIRDGTGTGLSEQVKALHGRVSVRDRVVRDSLRSFAVTYAALCRRDEARRFVFTTTAERRNQRGFDVLAAWDNPERIGDVVGALRELLPPKEEKDDSKGVLADALAWLDKDADRWTDFVRAVDWKFEEDDLDAVRGRIGDGLRRREVEPNEALVDLLVAELLRASVEAEPKGRTRTRQDLADFLESAEKDLVRWTATPRAVRLRAVFEEAGTIRRLLYDGVRPLPEKLTPGRLLTAAYEVVPFHGEARRDALDALAQWCSDPEKKRGVWLWTGEGGVGKTRLLIEWCRRLRAQGWHAGFLLRDVDSADLRDLVKGQVARFVVVDYAETRLDAVRPLLRAMATADRGPPCRVVLLARRAADWWRILAEDDADVGDLVLGSPPPRTVDVLVPRGAERDAAFYAAVAAFGAVLGGDGEGAVSDFAGEDFDRVLYLHMAALAAVRGEAIGGARDALDKTLEHERRFWTREIEGLGVSRPQELLLREAVPRTVAALTLVGGAADADSAASTIAAATAGLALGDDVRDTLGRLLLRPLYGGVGYLEGLQPDLLGEELVAASLRDDAALLVRVLGVADESGRMEILTVLTRLARRRTEEERWLERAFGVRLEELAEVALAVAVETGDPVGRVLAGFVETEASFELAERLMERCNRADYHLSVPLFEVACEATRRCLEARRASWPNPDEVQLKDLSRLALNLGGRLRHLGRRPEALVATKEAVEIDRQLAANRPEAFRPDLAQSLQNLGGMLSDLGRRPDALLATKEAVEILRQLGAERPDTYRPDLAMSLSKLGIRLGALGRREEALLATEESVAIQRGVTAHQTDQGEKKKDAFRNDLARCLQNLGNRLSDLERWEEALEATQEAVKIRRQLVANRPDIFQPGLASILDNLGSDLSDLGRYGEALEATQEAIEIRRQLADERPDAFRPDLATCLNNQSEILSDLGRQKEALDAEEEAVRLLAPFFERLPAAFADWMTQMVENYRKRADELGRPADAELLRRIDGTFEGLRERPGSGD